MNKESAVEVVERSTVASNHRWTVLGAIAVAVFVDMGYYAMIVPVLPLVLESAGATDHDLTAWQGAVYSVYALGLITATPIVGMISDRSGQRKTLLVAGAICMLISVLIFLFVRNLWILLAARILQGVSAASTWVIGFAMVSDVFEAEQLGVAFGLLTCVQTVGQLVGVLVGGFFGNSENNWIGALTIGSFAINWQWPFWIYFVLGVLDLVIRFLVPVSSDLASESVGEDKDKESLMQVMRKSIAGLLLLVTTRDIFMILLMNVFVSGSLCAVEAYMALWIERIWRLGTDKCSLVLLMMSMPQLVVAPMMGYISDRVPRFWIIVSLLMMQAVTLPILGGDLVMGRWALLLVLSAIYGSLVVSAKMMVAPQLAAIVRAMRCNGFAQGYALGNMSFSVGMILGPLIGGFFYDVYGFSVMTMVLGLLLALYGIAFFSLATRRIPSVVLCEH